jgi:Zn-dependent protease
VFFRPIPLFALFGFQVRLDASWFLLAVLVVWSLATGLFPQRLPGLEPAVYWWMGVLGLIGLAASIVLHELAHALVARRHGMPIRGITLFIFGGVAEMQDEATSPRAEFLMAVAGPLMSFAVAGLMWLLAGAGLPETVALVAGYLALINLVLAVFNLVPAFPLDGGRMLRAALWGWTGDLVRSTRVASAIGSGFGVLLIVLGVVAVVGGDFVAGMWWFLIGLFVRAAAAGALEGVAVREAFAGRPVSDFMRRDPIAADADATVAELVSEYVFRHYLKSFPVVDRGRLVGCVGVEDVRKVEEARRPLVRVREVMEPCDAERTVAPETDAAAALRQMQRTGRTRLIVVRTGELVGVVSLSDLLSYLSMARDLGMRPPPPPASREEAPAPWGRGHASADGRGWR